jgi:hypothetical protein
VAKDREAAFLKQQQDEMKKQVLSEEQKRIRDEEKKVRGRCLSNHDVSDCLTVISSSLLTWCFICGGN